MFELLYVFQFIYVLIVASASTWLRAFFVPPVVCLMFVLTAASPFSSVRFFTPCRVFDVCVDSS